jgi:quercetin dioxygenase-like cupin family protein
VSNDQEDIVVQQPTPASRPYARAAGGDLSRWYGGHFFTFLARAQDTGGQLALFDTLIRKGLEPPPHTHSREDEGYYLLDGHMTFVAGDQTLEAAAGTFVWLPRGVQHGFTCDTDEARTIVLVMPAGLEAVFHALSEPAGQLALPPMPEGPPDVERMIRLFGEHGVTFAAPPPAAAG